MPKPMPEMTVAAAVPPDRSRVYFQECADHPFSPAATECDLANAWWLAEAAFAAYETFDPPASQPIDLGPLQDAGYRVTPSSAGTTQFLAIENDRVLIVAFRGTRIDGFTLPFLKTEGFALNWGDIVTDARFLPKKIEPGITVHQGFYDAYLTIENQLATAMTPAVAAGRPIWFCGHSLGAALATLAAYRQRGQVHGLYTFGSPRVGNTAFVETLTAAIPNICRFVHHRDVVTTMPPEGAGTLGYEHVGKLKYITGQKTWKIQEGEKAGLSLSALAADAFAHAKEVAQVFTANFSLLKPGTWPITLEAIADHSPIYYSNKIFNAHEDSKAGV